MRANEIKYFEYYPHYSGDTLTAEMTIDLGLFSLLQNMIIDGEECEIEVDEIIDHLEKVNDDADQYALHAALTNDGYDDESRREGVQKILRSLKRKGYFLGAWEEGTFFFALKGAEKVAKEAWAKEEAKYLADDLIDMW